MIPSVKKLPPEQRRLLKLYSRMGDREKASLLDYAEFLVARNEEEAAPQPVARPAEPQEIARPESESVVAAIKRLSKTYHMLDTQAIFNETASLMTAHVMQGRPAVEVIDELEELFAQQYRDFRTPHNE